MIPHGNVTKVASILILFCLLFVSQLQQFKRSCLDLPFLSQHLSSYSYSWGGKEAFSGQVRDILSLACPGLALGSPPSLTCPRITLRRSPGVFLNHLYWHLSMRRSNNFIPTSSWITELLKYIWGRAQTHFGGWLLLPFASATFFFWSLPTVSGHWWESGCW